MKAQFGRWFVCLSGAALVMGAITAALYATHSWGGYHWARTSNPFTLKLGDNVSPAWDPYLQKASDDWSLSGVLDTTVVTGLTTSRRCKPTLGRVEVCADKYGANGWLGIAQIWVSGSHIAQGLTKMNDTYFNTAMYNKPEWRQFVMCQEIGHTFGLDHQDTNFNNVNLGSCMDYTNDPSGTSVSQGPKSNESPNTHDYDELNIIYGHLDSTSTVLAQTASGPGNGRMPPAMSDIELAGPAQWGRIVKGSPERGFSVHELDFGGGHKVFTFVLWVRPEHHVE